MHFYSFLESPPEHYRQFKKWVNSLKYSIEGKHRKGTCSPYLSELKLIDIRIKEEAMERFIQDLRNNTSLIDYKLKPSKKGGIKKHFGRTLNLFDWLLRLFTPFKKIEIPDIEKNKKEFKPWIYIKSIGLIKDPKDEDGEDLL